MVMVNLWDLKVGTQLRYDVPDKEKNEDIRKENGTVIEVISVEKFYDVNFMPVLIHEVVDINTGDHFGLGGIANTYLTIVKEGDGTSQYKSDICRDLIIGMDK